MANKSEKANMSGEAYLKGRKAGVEGPSGKAQKGVAEKTVPADKMDQSDSGSAQTDLTSAAHSLYQRAVKNEGDEMGDRALFDR